MVLLSLSDLVFSGGSIFRIAFSRSFACELLFCKKQTLANIRYTRGSNVSNQDNGIVLLPALFAEAFLQEGQGAIKKAHWILLSPVGLLANGFNCWCVSGNVMEYVYIQKKYFSQSWVLPWTHVVNLVSEYLRSSASSYKTMINESVLIAVVITAMLLLSARKWLRISYQIYAWSQITLLLTASWVISFPRLALVIFPLFIILAKLGRNDEIHKLLSVATALCMGGLFAIFVSGRWAF
jgi:hypothetical protein